MRAVGIEERRDRAGVRNSAGEDFEKRSPKPAKAGLHERPDSTCDLTFQIRIDVSAALAKQVLDQESAAPVLGSAKDTVRYGQDILREQHSIASGILFVLREKTGKAADRRRTEADQDRRPIVGEALEVAPQGSSCLGSGQGIGRACEVIEPDRAVARLEEPLMAQLGHAEALFLLGKCTAVDATLAGNQVRNMRVAEQRDTVGTQIGRALDRVGQVVECLPRWAVHQSRS